MKKLYYIMLLPLLALLGSCSNDVIDDLNGTFDDIERDNFTSVTTEPTEKLKKGLKCLKMVFVTSDNAEFHFNAVSREWILPTGTYTPADNLNAPKDLQYVGYVIRNGASSGNFTEGNIEVSFINNMYVISGLTRTADGKTYMLNYRGAISFEIGEDDPEPSGYVVSLQASPHYIMDMTTWQPVAIQGITKYTMSISSPEGAESAVFELLNVDNLGGEGLAGTYTIADNAVEAGQMCNGFYMPEYNAMGGSCVVGSDGKKQFLTKGSIELSFVDGLSGERLLNIKGTDLDWIGEGGSGKAGVNIPFALIVEPSGYTVRIKSEPHMTLDANWQPVPVPGVSKYTLTFTNPQGGESAMIELLNADNLGVDGLAGSYIIAENAIEIGKICNGYSIPEFGVEGGSYVVAEDGNKQFLAAGGNITVSVAAGKYVSVSGDDIDWTGAAGAGKVTVNLPFAALVTE